LAAWTMSPSLDAAAAACAVAGLAQAVRLLQWKGWRAAANPGVFVLHLGDGWIAVGFALAAAHPLFPGLALTDAAVHAWSAGAMGLCSLGVMSSMVRRHGGIAFQSPPLLSAAYACALAAVLIRMLAILLAGAHPIWLIVPVLAWAAAYALFLLFLAQTPLRIKTPPDWT